MGDMSHNILEVEKEVLNGYFEARSILSSNSNNCCLLYFNANIMCSFTKKLQLLGDFVSQIPNVLYVPQ